MSLKNLLDKSEYLICKYLELLFSGPSGKDWSVSIFGLFGQALAKKHDFALTKWSRDHLADP